MFPDTVIEEAAFDMVKVFAKRFVVVTEFAA
jgi:hypothetical protein